MSAGPLALWHTTDSNREAFATILRELAPDIPTIDRVRADLLDAAQPRGLTPAIRRAVALDILAMADEAAAPVLLCTCSTLGPGAESAADLTEAAVLRVDRPMVERALDHGPRVVVAAALASTLGPTRALLERAARDRAGYAARIAEVLRREAGDADAVILAQASMAGAADLLADLGVPVLASPRLGAEAAVAAWRARSG